MVSMHSTSNGLVYHLIALDDQTDVMCIVIRILAWTRVVGMNEKKPPFNIIIIITLAQ